MVYADWQEGGSSYLNLTVLLNDILGYCCQGSGRSETNKQLKFILARESGQLGIEVAMSP